VTFDRPAAIPCQPLPPIPAGCTLIPPEQPFSATPDACKQEVIKKRKKNSKGNQNTFLFNGRIKDE